MLIMKETMPRTVGIQQMTSNKICYLTDENKSVCLVRSAQE